jgi:imidazolonepropionase-like amidohydrolase
MRKAFIGAKIIPIEGDIIEEGVLVIEGNSIVEIGSVGNIKPGDAEIIDVTGKVITPGFIDAHSHVGLFEEGGDIRQIADGNEIAAVVGAHLRAMDAIFPEDLGFDDARKGGVTTMGITHGSANPIGSQNAVIKSKGLLIDEEMLIKAPAGVKFALGENPKRVGFLNNRAPSTRMAVAHIIREAFYKAKDYQNKWKLYHEKLALEENKPEKERKIVDRPDKDLGMEVLVDLLERKYPVRNHVHRADDIRTTIRLADEFGYELVIDHATEGYKIADYIAKRGIKCVVGPLMTNRSKREIVDREMAAPGKMVKAGIEVSITTDAPVIPISGLRDTVIMAVREGLPAEKALETITINPARVLTVDDRVGSLVVGKDADFLIFNGDPLDARCYIEQTYIEGKVVYDHTVHKSKVEKY